MPLFDGSGDRIWTVAEAAAELGYSEAYITKRAEAGMLPSFRCGGELLFSKAQLERWFLDPKVLMRSVNLDEGDS